MGNLHVEFNFMQIQANIAALAVGGYIAFSLIVWDFICHIPDEIRLLRDFRKVNWRSSDPWAFLFVRYTALATGISSLYHLCLKPPQCQLAFSIGQVFSICVLLSSGLISARRTVSMWGNHRIIIVVLAVLYAFMLGAWIAVSTQIRAKGVLTGSNFGTNCQVNSLVRWHPLNYASSTVYFGTMFFLSLTRLTRQRTERVLNLGLTPLNRACLFYLMVSGTSSIALFVIHVSRWTNAVVQRTSSPVYILLLAAMGQRIFLNSQADYTLRKRHIQELAKPKTPRWSWVPHRKPVVYPPADPYAGMSPRELAFTAGATVFMSASMGSEKTRSPDLESTNTNAVSHVTSPSASSNFSGVTSPVSSIAFNSPPGSPPALTIPSLVGKRPRSHQRGSDASVGYARPFSMRSGWLG